jgi:hypothetical protein
VTAASRDRKRDRGRAREGTAGTTSASDHVAPVGSRPANGRSPRRIWRAIVYGPVPALFLGAFLATGVGRNFRGNWSALFYFGDRWADGAALPRNPIVRDGAGYDGQFYYRVARDPLLPFARLRSHLLVAEVPGIDTPWYRYRRIAYPLAARFAAAGKPDALVWSFPVVSILGIWLGIVSTWRLFESFGWRGYWGMSYAFLPGLVFAATRNLCEGLALSVLSAALLAVARRRTPLAVGLLTIAHLAHETTALVSVGCFAHAAFARRSWRVAAVYLLPLGVVVIWSATVAVAFAANLGSVFSAAGGTGGLGLPLEGIWHKLLWLADPAHGPPAYSYLPTSRRFWRQEAALMPPIVLALFLLLREGWCVGPRSGRPDLRCPSSLSRTATGSGRMLRATRGSRRSRSYWRCDRWPSLPIVSAMRFSRVCHSPRGLRSARARTTGGTGRSCSSEACRHSIGPIRATTSPSESSRSRVWPPRSRNRRMRARASSVAAD